ncbi:MAG: GNAT family N-acetyltransferase [Clostridia bacterium]
MARLYGERVMLREYKKEDLQHMRMWVNDPEVVKNLSDVFLYPHTLNATENFLNTILEGKSEEKGFVIADRDTEEYIGQIGLIDINWKNRVAVLGIVIGSEVNRNKGYGTEAIKVLEEFTFNTLNLNKLELQLRDYNLRGYSCYLKCGFKEEGRKRQNFYFNGAYTDSIFMGILKSEYEVIKENNGLV